MPLTGNTNITAAYGLNTQIGNVFTVFDCVKVQRVGMGFRKRFLGEKGIL